MAAPSHSQEATDSANLTASALEKLSSDETSDRSISKHEVPTMEAAPERRYAPIRSATKSSDRFQQLERTSGHPHGHLSEEERDELRSIATLHRTHTKTSQQPGMARVDTLAGVTDDDPRLDPEKPEFDIYVWCRTLMRALDEENIKTAKSGFTFKDLSVSGTGAALSLQRNVGSVLMAPFRLGEYFSIGGKPHKQIIRNFNGTVKSGEMLIVLGRPGSGCSTFLKTVCGQLTGLELEAGSTVSYNGIEQARMMKEFRGEVVYNQEVDKHFPHLTVGETLEFAAAARTPQTRPRAIERKTFIKHMTNVAMTVCGLSHTRNTKVGSDFVRGVSGGERKRVSIAEMMLAGGPIACWDNSTRGLDAATALEFTRSLRIASDLGGMVNAVAIYQASQAIYDLFDKAIVLYEGRLIYFGPTGEAKAYFEEMGWYCPPRQTTGDFLTSVTNPQERKARSGFEQKVPRTPDEFEAYWRKSGNSANNLKEMQENDAELDGGNALAEQRERHQEKQAKHMRPRSPYVISIPMMIRLCSRRAYQRIWNDKTSTVTTIFGQIVMSLIVGSIFYGTPNSTASFFSKGSALFFAILLNALISINEIGQLYEQREIVEKQASYAFYHPWTEAMAGVVTDLPVKFLIAVAFNLILYFLAGLRAEPSQFFIFFLFVFVAIMTMSSIFRSLAALTKTVSQALAYAGVMVLAIVVYTGFTLPRPYAHPWLVWISYINPVTYAFEAILVNEVHGRRFPCANLVPAPPFQSGDSFICGVAGAVAGELDVSGDAWAQSQYQYSYSHIWRNLGFLFLFQIFFLVVYLVATELNSATSSSAEVLVFRRGHVPKQVKSQDTRSDEEAGATEKVSSSSSADEKQGGEGAVSVIPAQKDVFTWRDIVYDISIKGEPRRLLDHVSGWVKPGTLTALMGVSGAGKTTLLDALAQRTSIGVITGDMFVNGKPLDSAFQRKTGYVQQQDLHLETTTVREALRFSAMLRQPKSTSKAEKYAFVEEVIDMLNMREFSEAVVGVPGEGLNVEQRKLLTIGVELAAKPALLLFLDEPTSGLDSQSSWAIVAFLRKLANSGQAVLSTIHQPSSILFQEFDRLLFLAKGGKTVYFGDIGENSHTLLNYFERNGARQCGDAENPAEFMLEIVGAGASGKSTKDWHSVWTESEEARAVQKELDRIHQEMDHREGSDGESEEASQEFAMPFLTQLYHVTYRVFQQYWRTPSYVWGKLLLGVASALFIGFSFYKQNSSQQGLQNTIFSIFMLTAICSTLVQQIMPRFVIQRSLYEVRERPSKAYSWAAFLIANIVVEIPYQMLMGILVFVSYYYPVYGDNQSSERQGLILLLCMQFFVFASTFAHMLIAALPDAETAGNIATLMFSMTLIFNGVMQPPSALPGFWLFMYRVSPLTYLVESLAATGLHARPITCAANELSRFAPPTGRTCGDYLSAYASVAGGRIIDPAATDMCEYCPLTSSDQFLAQVAITWEHRWRDYGIGFAYIFFNIAVAVLVYYAFRVRKWSGKSIKRTPALVGHYLTVVAMGVRTVFLGREEVGLAKVGSQRERRRKWGVY